MALFTMWPDCCIRSSVRVRYGVRHGGLDVVLSEARNDYIARVGRSGMKRSRWSAGLSGAAMNARRPSRSTDARQLLFVLTFRAFEPGRRRCAEVRTFRCPTLGRLSPIVDGLTILCDSKDSTFHITKSQRRNTSWSRLCHRLATAQYLLTVDSDKSNFFAVSLILA